MTTNDQHYINQVLNGNTNAFRVLVDNYKDLVYTLALRMLKNREEAEEVAQDSFIKIFKSLKKFKGKSKFSTWIYKITYNTCLDRIKSNRKYLRDISIDEFTHNKLIDLDNSLEKLETHEYNNAIKACIDLLPGEDAFLLTLYYYEEQSLEEIAKILNLNNNNVKVKLFRSRKKLATILESRLEPEIIEIYAKRR